MLAAVQVSARAAPPLTIHLMNGFQLKGLVKGFDSFTVILDCDGKQMMIYKHSISTITPLKPILYADNEYENTKLVSKKIDIIYKTEKLIEEYERIEKF